MCIHMYMHANCQRNKELISRPQGIFKKIPLDYKRFLISQQRFLSETAKFQENISINQDALSWS